MAETNSNFYMLMFCIFLIATYLTVRLNRVKMIPAFLIGGVANSISFFLYSAARGNNLTQAFAVGIILGVTFTAMSVILGKVFGMPTTETERIPAYIETSAVKRTV